MPKFQAGVAMMLWMNGEWAVNARRTPEWKHESVFDNSSFRRGALKPFFLDSLQNYCGFITFFPFLMVACCSLERREVLILMFHKSFLHQRICWKVCSSFWFPLVVLIELSCTDRGGGVLSRCLYSVSQQIFWVLFDIFIYQIHFTCRTVYQKLDNDICLLNVRLQTNC